MGENTTKRYLFSLEQRLAWLKETFADSPSVEVMTYQGLTADLCERIGARFIVRGLRNSTDPRTRERTADLERHPLGRQGVWAKAAAQSKATPEPPPVSSVQLALDLGDGPREGEVSGLPEMTPAESMAAELEILGLDVSRHVVEFYDPFLDAIGVTRSADLLQRRSRSELLVAGVKVATQTPPIRSGRRVVFLTLDDSTGPVDATFFEDVQGPYAAYL